MKKIILLALIVLFSGLFLASNAKAETLRWQDSEYNLKAGIPIPKRQLNTYHVCLNQETFGANIYQLSSCAREPVDMCLFAFYDEQGNLLEKTSGVGSDTTGNYEIKTKVTSCQQVIRDDLPELVFKGMGFTKDTGDEIKSRPKVLIKAFINIFSDLRGNFIFIIFIAVLVLIHKMKKRIQNKVILSLANTLFLLLLIGSILYIIFVWWFTYDFMMYGK